MATTPRGFRYPLPTDANDISVHFRQLAEDADRMPGIQAMTPTQRAALTASQRWNGMVIYNTVDRRFEYLDLTVNAWRVMNANDHGGLVNLGQDHHPQYLTAQRHASRTAHGTASVDHGSIAGLGDDDHTQYLTATRHAAAGGHDDLVVDHGNMQGLTDDDHSIYLNAARHDVQARHGAAAVNHGLIGGLNVPAHHGWAPSMHAKTTTPYTQGTVPAPGVGPWLMTAGHWQGQTGAAGRFQVDFPTPFPTGCLTFLYSPAAHDSYWLSFNDDDPTTNNPLTRAYARLRAREYTAGLPDWSNRTAKVFYLAIGY